MNFDIELFNKIESKIYELENEYQNSQGLILTEDDLKCQLYKKLLEIDELSKNYPTVDTDILSIPIHTELSWYDDKGLLTIKPDITILDPKNLSILHENRNQKKLPSKQYSFSGKAIIFELKFIKNKSGITHETFKSKIKSDIDKINRLFTKLQKQGAENQFFSYFIVFNKTDVMYNTFREQFEQEVNDHYKTIYCTGKVKFS